ncbi:MAG: hypothetical protein LBK03_08495 [Bacteroidales bacterium]|jgi:hypothetical protein|nr:hypothetical protein [Bacteroidales bacterium]
MKRIIIAFPILIFAFKAQSQVTLDSLLVKYYNLATTSKDSNFYKEKFFEVFPDNFQLFDSIYGFTKISIDSTYFSPLYFVSHEHILLFFDVLNLMDKNAFVKKVINISLNGYWNADAVGIFQDEMQKFILNNIEQFLRVLEHYTDIEIKNFWHFFFDSNIFDNNYNIRMYGKVYRNIRELNYTRILILLREQFQYDFHQYIISSWAKELENQ